MGKMKDSGVEWIGEIPEEWKIVKLSYLFETIGSGTTPPTSNPTYYDGNIFWVNTGDLNDGDLNEAQKTITNEAIKDFSALKIYNEGSIIIAMYGATIGKIAISKMKFAANQACCVLCEPKNCYHKYIYYWLLQNRDNIISLSYGGGQPNISQETIKSLKIQLPPTYEDQVQIADYLDYKCAEINNVIEAKEATNKKLKEYRQSAIYEAVTKGLDKSVRIRDSGIEWIGEIPEEWETIKIKYSSILKGRIGWQGLKANEFIEDGPYLITGTNFSDGKIDWDSCVHISEERYLEAPEIHVLEGDLLITKDGTVGKIALAENCPEKVSLNSGVLLIKNKDKVRYINKFLYYILLSDVFWKWFRSSQNGNSTIIHLYQEQFSNFIFSLPRTISEQIEIYIYLDRKCTEIDSIISTNNKIIEQLKEYRQSVIYEAVTGKIEV